MGLFDSGSVIFLGGSVQLWIRHSVGGFSCFFSSDVSCLLFNFHEIVVLRYSQGTHGLDLGCVTPHFDSVVLG